MQYKTIQQNSTEYHSTPKHSTIWRRIAQFRRYPLPIRAKNAEVQVLFDMLLPSKRRAKNGTNLTLRYRRKALLEAVVVSSPID